MFFLTVDYVPSAVLAVVRVISFNFTKLCGSRYYLLVTEGEMEVRETNYYY